MYSPFRLSIYNIVLLSSLNMFSVLTGGWGILQFDTFRQEETPLAKVKSYTLPKFRRYNKASLAELVPLEILGKHQQGLARGVWPSCSTYLIFLLECARVWPNAEVARFTLLYHQNFMRVYNLRVINLLWRQTFIELEALWNLTQREKHLIWNFKSVIFIEDYCRKSFSVKNWIWPLP